ncbi:MAG: hypothetical protein ABI580_09010, partial [Burkholderiaceae bacterium]
DEADVGAEGARLRDLLHAQGRRDEVSDCLADESAEGESGDVLAKPTIWKGDRGIVPIGVDRDVYITVPSSELRALGSEPLKSSIERLDPLVAPLQRGETVGRMLISAGGRQVAEVPIVALERVESGGLLRRAYDAIVLWWRKRNG